MDLPVEFQSRVDFFVSNTLIEQSLDSKSADAFLSKIHLSSIIKHNFVYRLDCSKAS